MKDLPNRRLGEGSDGPESEHLLWTDTQLTESVKNLVAECDGLKARIALQVAEINRRGITEESHVLTTKQWLVHECRMSKSAASTTLRTGRTLIDQPAVARLASTGEITSDGVRMLAAVANNHPADFDTDGGPLIDAATYLGTSDLRQAVRAWTQQVDYPSVIAEMDAKKKRRRLSVNQTWEGMWAVSGELDPESGSVVAEALLARANPGALDPEDTRTSAQRMADAFTDVCQYSLDHATNPTSGGEKPHVTVDVTWDTLSGASLGVAKVGTESMDPEDARRLACDAGITRMITGPEGELLDIGRKTRTIPAALRRALDRRDGGCGWSGCDAPVGWCDAHHIVHWVDGGPTSLDNLELLCRRHHTATHEGKHPRDIGPDPNP